MSAIRDYRFQTERLTVNEWHSFPLDEWPHRDLADVVQKILTHRVTQTLPPAWQGAYTRDRAERWIVERDREGLTLAAVDQANKQAIGLMVLFESEGFANLRLGYMLHESAWGKGYASEWVGGFINWCRNNQIHSITGGVERSNFASRRVLEKCGFLAVSGAKETGEQLYSIQLA